MRVVWPWTSWGCFPGCCVLVFLFFIRITVRRSLGFSQGILSTHVDKAICEGRTVKGLCEIWGFAVASHSLVGHATLYCIPSGPEFISSPCYVGETTNGRKSQSSNNSLLVRSGVQLSSQSTSNRVFVVSSVPPGKCRLSHDRFLPHSSSVFYHHIIIRRCINRLTCIVVK